VALPNDKPVEINPAVYKSDVSARALSLARWIDRLPPGVYLIELQKMNDAPTELHSIVRVVSVEESKPAGTYTPK